MTHSTDSNNVNFMINRTGSDNKCTDNSIQSVLKHYSSFVFLVSMKYLKDEERSKKATIAILKKMKQRLKHSIIPDIKKQLYAETIKFCNA